jgi:CBS domain-containing protein
MAGPRTARRALLAAPRGSRVDLGLHFFHHGDRSMQARIRQLLERKGRHVEIVSGDTTVWSAVACMNAHMIGSVLVVDLRTPIGILTERDVLVRVVAAGKDPHTTPVRDVMTAELITISADATVEEAMTIVTQRRCRHLPVTDESGVCGLISSGDLTSWVVRDQQQTIDDLHGYIRAS